MSRRTEKVESLVQQTVAAELTKQMGSNGAKITVTRVDVSPDMRNANVWISVLAEGTQQQDIYNEALSLRFDAQRELASVMTSKFVPRLHFKLDTGGEYFDRITRILKEL